MPDSTLYQYQRIYDDLIRRITDGEFMPGDKLPTENELAKRHGVSRITSKKALNMLAERGFACRQSGKGTFLNEDATHLPEPTVKPQDGRLLGLVADNLLQSFGLTLFYELDRAARSAGFRLYLRNTDCDQAREAEEIDYLRRLGAEGIFVIPTRAPFYNKALLRLVLDHYPVHILDSALSGIQVPFVCSSNRTGGEQLTKHLIDLGHRHIALATVDMKTAVSLQDRRDGYERALANQGLPYRKEYVLGGLQTGLIVKDAKGAAERDIVLLTEFLLANPQVSGIVVLQHALSSLVRYAAESAGRDVPRTLSIAVFDEIYDATGGFTYTHIKQDESLIAREAMKRMIDTLEGRSVELGSYIAPKMIIGKTTAHAPKGK